MAFLFATGLSAEGVETGDIRPRGTAARSSSHPAEPPTTSPAARPGSPGNRPGELSQLLNLARSNLVTDRTILTVVLKIRDDQVAGTYKGPTAP